MKRKIIQIAGSTHLVSLPKSWIVKNSVKKGEEVDVIEYYDKVIVSKMDGDNEETTSIDVSDMNMFVFRYLAAIYKSGYDKVDLIVKNGESLTSLSKQMNLMLPGYEIVDQKGNTLTIKNISRVIDTDFDILLRKIFLITKSLGNNTHDIIKNKEFEKIDDVLILEVTAARFCNFCQRILNKKGYKESRKVSFIYSIVHELEKIKNQYRYLCAHLKKHPNKANEETLALFNDANELFVLFYETFYKFEADNVKKIAEKRKYILDKADELFSKKNSDPVLLHHTINITDSVSSMIRSYLGMKV